jgi:uncharacterized membrane protein
MLPPEYLFLFQLEPLQWRRTLSGIAPVDKLSVVFVSVFAVLFLGERLALPNWLGVILIACGAVLVAYRA